MALFDQDRARLEQHLALAERHVAQGEAIIARQRRIVDELERDDHQDAAASARGLLIQFLELQKTHIADRDRLRGELGLG